MKLFFQDQLPSLLTPLPWHCWGLFLLSLVHFCCFHFRTGDESPHQHIWYISYINGLWTSQKDPAATKQGLFYFVQCMCPSLHILCFYCECIANCQALLSCYRIYNWQALHNVANKWNIFQSKSKLPHLQLTGITQCNLANMTKWNIFQTTAIGRHCTV